MKKWILFFVSILAISALQSQGQGLPPGWDYSPTPSTHIISLPLSCEPNINGWLLAPGDWIGVFYTNDEGELACGGAQEWLGDQNVGVIAFGDDSFTPVKDGFASGETITYKVYSWVVEKEYEADVTCNTGMPSTCSSYVSNGLSGVATLDAYGFFAVAEISTDVVCQGSSVTLNAIPSGGSGNYSYTWYSDPPGFNSNQQNTAATPLQNTTYFVDVTDSGETLTASVSVSVILPPEANAGETQTICENQTAQLNGTASNYISVLWSTAGDGIFSNPQALNPQYTPGSQDIANGSAHLTLTANPNEPCSIAATSDMLLQVVNVVEVDAGSDQTVCETDNIITNPIVNNASGVLWTTSGDGSFDDPTVSATTYYPGTGDIAAGNAVLTITAESISPCSASDNDSFMVSFAYLPEVDAGADLTICEDQTAGLNGTAGNYQSISWSTDGDGTFNDPTALAPVYTPGPADIAAGNVSLTLNAASVLPCSQNVEDDMIVNIVPLPSAFAGDDDTVCEIDDYEVSGSAGNYETIMWSTSGDGSFDDPGSLNAVYTLGDEDILNEEVVLTVSVSPQSPCTVTDSDEMLLTIFVLPQADAGEDATIEAEETLQLNGTASDYVLVLWSTSGDGDFSAYDILDPVYTPGPEDLEQAGAILTLTAFPNSPCLITAVDDLDLTIDTVTSVRENVSANVLTLYPNPSRNEVFVRMTGVINGPFTFKLISSKGEILINKKHDINDISSAEEFYINTSEIQSGIYVAVIQVNKDFYIRKLQIIE